MKLSVAANWDIELLDVLAQIPEVTSVYAKLPYDLVGGGRAGAVLPSVDLDTSAAYIQAAHKRGLSFNYLLNAPCLGNLEQTQEGKERLLAFIGRLVELGVDSVSISNLALVALVRRNYPELSIRGSVLSWPTNLPRLKYQESLGVDPLILPYSEFNRDFQALERILKGEVNLLTEVDRMSEELLVERIRHACPQHGILSEESAELRCGSDYRWIIDPLDGTTNYAHDYPIFCVSIALEIGAEVIYGVIYNPIIDEMFTVEKDRGAFLLIIELIELLLIRHCFFTVGAYEDRSCVSIEF